MKLVEHFIKGSMFHLYGFLDIFYHLGIDITSLVHCKVILNIILFDTLLKSLMQWNKSRNKSKPLLFFIAAYVFYKGLIYIYFFFRLCDFLF